MTLILLNRLPVPNLRQYCTLSLVLLSVVILYAQKLLYTIANDEYDHDIVNTTEISTEIDDSFHLNSSYIQENGYVYTTYKAITNEPWCLWVLINCCYCALLLFSKFVQNIIFVNLRVVEYQHIKDQFWNFIFLKFIFIFGVLNLDSANEVGMWITWFSIIGFLAIHSQICKDRFEYLSFSSTTPLWNHIKVIALLNCIICLSMVLMGIGVFVQYQIGFNFGLFMLIESFALTVRTLYIVARYIVYLWDLYYSTGQWDNKATVSYYVDFIFEIFIIFIDLFHYIHMLLYGNFFLSMASIIICMELRRLFGDLRKRIKRHSNYLKVIEKMEKRFPWASKDDLKMNDKCAICWENLDKARRLPCTHMFHHNCLRSWLEQDTSCPTCRKTLQDDKPTQQAPLQQDQAQPRNFLLRRMRTNLFSFNGSRYLSWLPNLSVEVTHNFGNAFFRINVSETQLNLMAQQVNQVFPHVPLQDILNNLRETHSAEITIENILNGRLNLNANDIDDNGGQVFAENEFDTSETESYNSNSDQEQQAAVPPLESSQTTASKTNESSSGGLYLDRKRELIEAAKRRYLSRMNSNTNEETILRQRNISSM